MRYSRECRAIVTRQLCVTSEKSGLHKCGVSPQTQTSSEMNLIEWRMSLPSGSLSEWTQISSNRWWTDDLTPGLQKKTTNCIKPLSLGLKLDITLRYLVTGDSYKSLGSGCPPPTSLSVFLPDVCKAIYDNYHETAFKCLLRQVELPSLLWLHRWQPTPHSVSLFYNYKGLYSIVILTLVDANYRFIYVDVGAYGAHTNFGIFRECGLYYALEQDEAGLPPSDPLPGGDIDVLIFIVGDDPFAFRSWMICHANLFNVFKIPATRMVYIKDPLLLIGNNNYVGFLPHYLSDAI